MIRLEQIFTKSLTLTQALPVHVMEFMETSAVFNMEHKSTILALLLLLLFLDRLLRAMLLLVRL